MAKENLEQASGTKLKHFLGSFDVVLCDCDGVIWDDKEVLGGIKETLEILRSRGKSIKFVTNNTLHSLDNFCKKISSVYEVTVQDVITPTLAMIEHLKKIGIMKKVFIVGSTQMKQEFVNAGFDVVKYSDSTLEENYSGLIQIINDNNEDVGVVISDYDMNMQYSDLLKAGLYLQQPNVLFITGATETSVILKGKNIIGPGYFKNILEDLSGRKSISFGKPDAMLNTYLQARFGIKNSSRTLFIGDSLEQDMCFANRFGYKKLLVLTGKTKLNDLTTLLEPELSPDFYISSLGELHRFITLHGL